MRSAGRRCQAAMSRQRRFSRESAASVALTGERMDAHPYHSSAKTSRSFCSCSADKLLAISSALPLDGNSSLIRSSTASEVSRKSADVPGVTRCLTALMKPSSIPTSVIEPVNAPIAAPIAAPRSGMKKINPKSMPQKAPPSAPAAARLLSCPRLRLLLADLPGHHGGVLNIDQLLGLQCAEPLGCLVGIADAGKGPCGECGH